ncbi:MAG TPA: hypothetical protein VMW12_13205 [Candidatus Dormibacteraeota bacterium]|nr:hypothetical protein [Candidatus Dormibacteraeota bacterium]
MIEVLGPAGEDEIAAIAAVLATFDVPADRSPASTGSAWKLAMRLPDADRDDIRACTFTHASNRW